MDKKTLQLINKLAHPLMQDCPKDCPNLSNKPKDQGCGMDVCLNQIYQITRDELNT